MYKRQWKDFHSFDDIPQIKNPNSGYLFSANQNPFFVTDVKDNLNPDDFVSTFGFQTRTTNRAYRSYELLNRDTDITYEEISLIKHDNKFSYNSRQYAFMEKIFNKDLYLNYKSDFSPDDFHHVAFKTTNYEEMVEFYKKLFGCEPLYQSDQITFLAFDDEHHRVAIANTSDVLKNLGFIPKLIMNLKLFLNKKIPTIVGLDHISYRINPIDRWFNFYFEAKERGLDPLWTINHGWISGIYLSLIHI